jgi:hypothetical protein
MAYDPTRINLGEARLLAIQGIIQAAIPSLNIVLGRDNITNGLVTVPLSGNSVIIGDIETLWDNTSLGNVLFAVCAGGLQAGRDIDTAYEFIDQSPTGGRRLTVTTSIACYLHPSTYRSQFVISQAYNREIARERISDWIRAGVLNTPANSVITLASSEFTNPPNTDMLFRCKATVSKGFFLKSAGKDVGVFGINIEHEGTIA